MGRNFIMKVFLSHQMTNLNPKYIFELREEAKRRVREEYEGEQISFVDDYINDIVPKNANKLWHLEYTIHKLQEADMIVFVEPYIKNAECIVVNEIAQNYAIPHFTISLRDFFMNHVGK